MIFLLYYSQGLADSTVIAKVNGALWDLDRPFEGDAELKLLKFDSDEGKTFYYSSNISMCMNLYVLCLFIYNYITFTKPCLDHHYSAQQIYI